MYREYDESNIDDWLSCLEKSIYTGEWKADKIIEWATLMDFQTVGFADYQNVRNFFRKDGIMVHLFVTKEMVDNDWNLFHDYIFHEVAIPVIEQRIMKRGTFSIIFSDGEENKKWLKGTSLENLPLPSAMLIDFVSSFIFYEV